MVEKASVTPPVARRKTKRRVSRRAIQKFVDELVERFQPEKVILFGSYAYGTPHDDSDVDLLVVMRTKNEIEESVRIHLAMDAPFPVVIIVRTLRNLANRLKWEDWFLRDVVEKGILLYEAPHSRMGKKSGG